MDTVELDKLKQEYKKLKDKRNKVTSKFSKLLFSVNIPQRKSTQLIQYFEQNNYLDYCKGYNEAQQHQLENKIKEFKIQIDIKRQKKST